MGSCFPYKLLYNLFMEIMAKRLVELRNKRGLVQKDVAEYLGVTKSTYGFISKSAGTFARGYQKARRLFCCVHRLLVGAHRS